MPLDLHRPRPRGLSHFELLIVLAILGILAALAIGELTTRSRRSKTEEAARGLADMFNGIAAYFNEPRPDYAGGAGLPPHRCPHPVDRPLAGEVGPTPSLAVRCADGPKGRCTPMAGASRPGTYELSEWTANPVWLDIGFRHTGGHHFHYSYRFRNLPTPDGHGACEFTVRATADLDGDGVWSVYERSGHADRTGVKADAGLRIERPLE
jgi:prepilin-type N-terminal cleavage/methylation domain-containing protein